MAGRTGLFEGWWYGVRGVSFCFSFRAFPHILVRRFSDGFSAFGVQSGYGSCLSQEGSRKYGITRTMSASNGSFGKKENAHHFFITTLILPRPFVRYRTTSRYPSTCGRHVAASWPSRPSATSRYLQLELDNRQQPYPGLLHSLITRAPVLVSP